MVQIAVSVPPGTYLHMSEVKHLRVKCLTQGHNIETTMSQHQAGIEPARQAAGESATL